MGNRKSAQQFYRELLYTGTVEYRGRFEVVDCQCYKVWVRRWSTIYVLGTRIFHQSLVLKVICQTPVFSDVDALVIRQSPMWLGIRSNKLQCELLKRPHIALVCSQKRFWSAPKSALFDQPSQYARGFYWSLAFYGGTINSFRQSAYAHKLIYTFPDQRKPKTGFLSTSHSAPMVSSDVSSCFSRHIYLGSTVYVKLSKQHHTVMTFGTFCMMLFSTLSWLETTFNLRVIPYQLVWYRHL